jgi:hypothetical protein
MLLELARPVTLLGSILSLLLVFYTAFLGTETDVRQRIYDSLAVLALAAAFSILSGLTFREGGGEPSEESLAAMRRVTQGVGWKPQPKLRLVADHGRLLVSPRRELRLAETFPVQVFLWATAIMVVLFLLSWFLETYVLSLRR